MQDHYLEIDHSLSQIFSKCKNIIKIDFVLYPVKLCVCVLLMMLKLYLFWDSLSGKTCPSINKITFHKLDENCLVAIEEIYQTLPYFL